MTKLLFINACMRGAGISRTYKLCRTFLDEYIAGDAGVAVSEIDLARKELPSLNGDSIKLRDTLIDSGETCNDMFLLAREFADADKIIVGAPYWDLSFPSALKAYVEHISVRNVTFRNTASGVTGLCRAEKLLYITTAGGYMTDADFGCSYFRGLCGMYGIGHFETLCAEGLDLDENDAEKIMLAAETEAVNAARTF